MSGPEGGKSETVVISLFQSPDGDSLCPDSIIKINGPASLPVFQSPDGDSLCPDGKHVTKRYRRAVGFSPLTGILYVRTGDQSSKAVLGREVSVP